MKITEAIVKIVLVAAITFGLYGLNSAAAQETKAPVKPEVPAAVLTAFQQAYPGAIIKGSGKEVEKGIVYYEIESVDSTINRDLLYSADGKLLEIEETIPPTNLPITVSQTIAKDYPQGKIIKSEKLIRGEVIEYELVIASGKQKVEVALDINGKVLKTEKLAKKEKNAKEAKEEDDDKN